MSYESDAEIGRKVESPYTEKNRISFMGNFYTNILLKGPQQAKVGQTLRGKGLVAYVTPSAGGYTTVYEEECDMQNDRALKKLTSELSATFHCLAFAVLNHDDVALFYWLYKDGELIDRYESNPEFSDRADIGFFEFLLSAIWRPKPKPAKVAVPKGGKARLLCEAFDVEEKSAEVEVILRKESGAGGFLIEVERHERLIRLLNLPECTVGVGFGDISRGDELLGLELDKMEFTGQ
jgi:hypothetical protein